MSVHAQGTLEAQGYNVTLVEYRVRMNLFFIIFVPFWILLVGSMAIPAFLEGAVEGMVILVVGIGVMSLLYLQMQNGKRTLSRAIEQALISSQIAYEPEYFEPKIQWRKRL